MDTDRDEPVADENWVAEALGCYEGQLVRYATALLGDADLARDIVQDTFLSLHTLEPRDRSRLENHLGPWLFRVCRNRAVDVLRKEGRVVSNELEGNAEIEPLESSRDEEIQREDVYKRIFQIIGSLPSRQQEVMRLKFGAELSYREISSVTGLSESNVGYLLHVAIKTIRQQLQADADTALGV